MNTNRDQEKRNEAKDEAVLAAVRAPKVRYIAR